MAQRVQIIVEAKDATSGIFRGITSQMGALGGVVEELTAKNVNWGNVASMAATMVVKGLQEAAKATVNYANDVRALSMLSGESTENTSRFIQVLDDYKLSADDALLATKALTKNGLTPNLETLAKLSDEYLNLNSVEEKNEFILKNLGKGGLQWVEVLNKGSAALREQGAAVNESLILSQQAVDNARAYELALDDWNDAVLALKVSIGNELLPALTSMMKGISNSAAIREEANRLLTEGVAGNREEALTMAAATVARQQSTAAVMENKSALDDNTLSAQEQAEAIKAMTAANTGMLSLITSLQGETERYKNTTAELNVQHTELIKQHAAGLISGEEYRAGVEGITAAVAKNKQEHIDAGNKIAFSLLQQKLAVGGLEDAEFNFLLKTGVQWGIFDQTVANTAANMDHQMGAMADSYMEVIPKQTQFNEKIKAAQNLSGQTWTYFFDIQVSGKIPNLPWADRLDADNRPGSGGMQSGGTVYAGRPVTVGENGAEPLFPEVNGRILGHAESLHALTLGGGGGGTNYFYGPVTLELAADAGNGLMGLR